MTWTAIPDDELEEICAGMKAAEESGLFNEMLKVECRSNTQSINKEALLDQMHTGMHLYRSTFKKIYGYELSYPGFAEQAISRLEDLGCKKARDYYETVRAEIDEQYAQEMTKAGAWYRRQCEKEREELQRKAVIEPRKDQEAEQVELLGLLETKRQILKELLRIQNGKSTE